MMNTRPKRTFGIVALMILSPIALFLASCKTPSDAEVKSAIEVNGLETKWVMKEYRQWPNPILKIVPVVSFNVKNNSANPLQYVNFNALFKEKFAAENRGDCFLAAIGREPIQPGSLSPTIMMRSNFGVSASTLQAIKTSPGWGKSWIVRLFVQWKGSRPVLLGEWPVSLTIDFKEPEPVHMGGEKKEPEPKK
jgi:hypothetical protein